MRHFEGNENFGRENHSPRQIFPPLPLINVALPQKTLLNPQSFQTTLSEGPKPRSYCYCFAAVTSVRGTSGKGRERGEIIRERRTREKLEGSPLSFLSGIALSNNYPVFLPFPCLPRGLCSYIFIETAAANFLAYLRTSVTTCCT